MLSEKISAIPSIKTSSGDYNGDLTCSHPVSLNSCPLLGQLVNQVCNTAAVASSVCMPTFCWGVTDACGVCNGKSVRDDCGTCWGEGASKQSTKTWNSACADCKGVAYGSQTFDECGHCLSKDDPTRNVCKATSVTTGLVSSIIFSLLFLAAGGYGATWYMKKREEAMKIEFDERFKRYQPLGDMEDQFVSNRSAKEWVGEKVGLLAQALSPRGSKSSTDTSFEAVKTNL